MQLNVEGELYIDLEDADTWIGISSGAVADGYAKCFWVRPTGVTAWTSSATYTCDQKWMPKELLYNE